MQSILLILDDSLEKVVSRASLKIKKKKFMHSINSCKWKLFEEGLSGLWKRSELYYTPFSAEPSKTKK